MPRDAFPSNNRATAWQDVLVESFVGTEADLEFQIELSSGSEHLRLHARAGGLEIADAQDMGGPDLAIRFRDFTLKEVLLGKAPTCDVFRDGEIAVGDGWIPAAPAAEVALPHAGRFESISGATLTVATHVTTTVFGEVGICENWRDGALASSELIPMSQLERHAADVRVSCTLTQLAAIRRRKLTLLDALADGVGLFGEWPHLMCFMELFQHLAYLPIWEADSAVEAQATWGAIFSSPAYGDAALRAQLDSVVAA